MPNFKRIGGGPWKSPDDLTWNDPGLEIDISRQWTIGPPVVEIWWSCQISGGPDVANSQYLFVKSNTAEIIFPFLYKHLNNPCNT